MIRNFTYENWLIKSQKQKQNLYFNLINMWNFTKQVLWTKDQNAWSWENRINVSLFFYLLTKPRFRQNLLRNLKNIWMLIFLLSIIIFILIFLWKQNIMLQEVNAKTENKKEVKYDNIRQVLRLDNCRVVQKEESHILEGKGSVFAQDIACEKWKSFEVKAPKWKWEYLVVKKVINDKILWDYIVLKHAEYLFLFAHTKSDLFVWKKIKAWDDIWYTIYKNKDKDKTKNWSTENYHLHFELWKNDYNISLKEITEWKTTFNMEYTYDLRKQRHWNLENDEALDYILDFEWKFIKCAKWDWKQYSNWFSTRAKYKTECITIEEWKKRFRGHVDMVVENVYKNHFLKYRNQRVALSSALYNLWVWSSIVEVKNLKTEKSIKKHFLKFVKSEWKALKWLIKRREIEANKYLNKI